MTFSFKYKTQDFQTDAVNAVLDVFSGQNRTSPVRNVSSLSQERNLLNLNINDENLSSSYPNPKIQLSNDELLKNINEVQKRNNVTKSEKIICDIYGACCLDVEMETGTGKTYVYIKTMFELNKMYGWNKFIVVVPSIAIREGVKKSFETMEQHFMELYGVKARYFVYDGNNLSRIRSFATDSNLNVMIINMQAFNSSFDESGRSTETRRRIYSSRDEFGSMRPIDVIKELHPILILDEPQNMGGSKTQKGLSNFDPLFSLAYSATHKDHHNTVYVLDALDAYQKKLVKRIEVKGIEIENTGGFSAYVHLEEIFVSPKRPPIALIEIDTKCTSGTRRVHKKVGKGDNLYELSKNLEVYKDGFVIDEVDCINNKIVFTNGVSILCGNALGDFSADLLRRLQMRSTIKSHLEKEAQLFNRGIKCLSLFFIDKVDNYRKYDEDGNIVSSLYQQIFEEEYSLALDEALKDARPEYAIYLQNIKADETHAGYFSIDKNGRAIDSKVGRRQNASEDKNAYDLILKNKERLLSLEEPVRFIFSHSALREGWDNPNVFQICTLKDGGDSTTLKRQEVGRGLRLCVNQDGERQDSSIGIDVVHKINVLTVVASEGYESFVRDLQSEIKENLYERPKKADLQTITNFVKTIKGLECDISVIENLSNEYHRYLIRCGYVDDSDNVTDSFSNDYGDSNLKSVPEGCEPDKEKLHQFTYSIHNNTFTNFGITNANESKCLVNKLNINFDKIEFQKLWNRINHKSSYLVDFDSNELITDAVKHINDNLVVSSLQTRETIGLQKEVKTNDNSLNWLDFNEASVSSSVQGIDINITSKFDLIGRVANETELTRKTVSEILSRIRSDKFALYKANPEDFITKTSKLINEKKATRIVEQITYRLSDETYSSDIFTASTNFKYSDAFESSKNVQDYVLADSTTERDFASKLEGSDEVVVYAKLPRGFKIPTPVGNYAPDWAIVFGGESSGLKDIYFVAETKGTMDSMQLRPVENAKILCAKRLFEQNVKDVRFEQIDSYENLLNIMRS